MEQSMQEFWQEVVLYSFLGMAAYMDGKKGVIPVWLSGSAFGAGLCLAWWDGGWGIVWYLMRFLLFAAPFFVLGLCGMMGGGDFKLFGIIGALCGGIHGSRILLCTLAFAGAAALTKMCRNGSLQRRMQVFLWYCRRCAAARVWYRYPVTVRPEDTLHLGVFALMGAAAAELLRWWM